jgi:hypothetical protein
MAKIGDIQYRVECLVCGKEFLVNEVSSPIPEHPSEGQKVEPYIPNVPCAGSGLIGTLKH